MAEIGNYRYIQGKEQVYSELRNVMANIEERSGWDCDTFVECVLKFYYEADDYYERVMKHIVELSDNEEYTQRDIQIAELGILAEELGFGKHYFVGRNSYFMFGYEPSTQMNFIEVCLYHK